METKTEEIPNRILTRILTCVYCGQEYPQGTPSWGNNKVLTDHIRVCPKHPLRKAEADILRLKNALIGIVGADTRKALEELKQGLQIISLSEKDRIKNINTIDALLSVID